MSVKYVDYAGVVLFGGRRLCDSSSSIWQLEMRSLKDENQQLKCELVRKEKALAEAAALLVLQKKFHALSEKEDK